MKTTASLAIGAIVAALTAGSVQAAVISIGDISATPDGSANRFGENYDIQTPNDGNVVLRNVADNQELAYIVTTFNFGTNTLADIGIGFDQNYTNPDDNDLSPSRVGVNMEDGGLTKFIGGLSGSGNFGNMAGQSVTLIIEFDYDRNRNTENNNDTLGAFWINPTGTSTQGSPDVASTNAWNSNSFPELILYIDNNSTPGTAGTSSITNTTLLTGDHATFENALSYATIPEPTSAILLGLGAAGLLLRQRRG